MHDGKSQGPAQNADIQERANAGTKTKDSDSLHPRIHIGLPAAFSRAARISAMGAGRPLQIDSARAP